jgi:acyl carrier protein
MNNREKYDALFIDTFMLEAEELNGLKYQEVPSWDSVGHMQLMTALEESFGIELDIDDIIEFSSYEMGKTILRKYSIEIDQLT